MDRFYYSCSNDQKSAGLIRYLLFPSQRVKQEKEQAEEELSKKLKAKDEELITLESSMEQLKSQITVRLIHDRLL